MAKFPYDKPPELSDINYIIRSINAPPAGLTCPRLFTALIIKIPPKGPKVLSTSWVHLSSHLLGSSLLPPPTNWVQSQELFFLTFIHTKLVPTFRPLQQSLCPEMFLFQALSCHPKYSSRTLFDPQLQRSPSHILCHNTWLIFFMALTSLYNYGTLCHLLLGPLEGKRVCPFLPSKDTGEFGGAPGPARSSPRASPRGLQGKEVPPRFGCSATLPRSCLEPPQTLPGAHSELNPSREPFRSEGSPPQYLPTPGDTRALGLIW